MRIHTRVGALAIAAALAVAACGGGGTATGSAAGATSGSTGATPPACLSFADIYALAGPESTGFTDWSQAADIATALGSTTTFPTLPLSITAPGEESGTFDSFVEITGIEGIAEGRGVAEEERTIRPDYVASANDNAIIEGIAESAGSFGWVGFAFYEENLDTVRAFTISEEPGGTCVEPTADTIASNEYPISRDLYIYVNKAKAESNPAVAAYVDFYLADGNIDKVLAAVPYVPLEPAVLTEQRRVWDAATPTVTASPDGAIFVTGSSTVEPISNGIAEAFKAANPGFDYEVAGPGTGDGFQRFCAGEADIADASRAIRDNENEKGKCDAAGIEYVEIKVAIDGIAVLTQK